MPVWLRVALIGNHVIDPNEISVQVILNLPAEFPSDAAEVVQRVIPMLVHDIICEK